MGRCEYVDESKSSYDGYHCLITGGKVEYSLTRAYCRYDSDCRHCPIRGGDDRFRKRPEPKPEPEPKQNTYSSYEDDNSSQSTPTPTIPDRGGGGGGGGGGIGFDGCVARIMGAVAVLLAGAMALLIAGSVLLSWLGFFREDVSLNLTVPAGVNPRHFTMEVISHDPDEDYHVDSAKVDKEGSAKVRMEMGLNSIYLIYDDEKISLSDTPLNGEEAATIDLDYDQVEEQLCRMVIVNLKDMEDTPIQVGNLTILDEGGASMQWMPVGASRIVLVIPDGWTGRNVTLAAEGYEPLVMAVEGKDRLEGAEVRLRPGV